MGKGFGNLMRQAKQMQKKLEETKAQLKKKTYEGQAGQEQVKATVNGEYELQKLTINKDVIDPDDTEMMEDLIVLAVNDAIAKAREESDGEMEKLTGGMGINMPGLF